MEHDIGPQHSGDHRFLKAARLHQSKYRALKLRIPFENYGNYLTPADAEKGLNFYQGFGVFASVRSRYPAFSKDVYSNMLRSKHIPFNLFHPLNADDNYRLQVFSRLLGARLRSVHPIRIEYAPSPASDYLDDATSFDAYVEFEEDAGRGLLGIEVKYTERDYKLKSGSKEHRCVNDNCSRYFQVMSESRIYSPGNESHLIQDSYRQMWRNQLLAESIIQRHSDRFSSCTLLTVYPRGNEHMAKVCKSYPLFLAMHKRKFASATYEDFIETCRSYATSAEQIDWVTYLRERYIVS
jgi:hypothetical protein